VSTVRTIEEDPNRTPRWLLPALLVLLILIILGAAYFATHRNMFGSSATSTPTVSPTPVVVTGTPPPVTATPKTGPTGTPRAGPTGTPQAGPTATPKTVPAGLKLGVVQHPRAELLGIQQGANQNNPTYTPYLDPFAVAKANLPAYGFPTVNIVAPPAAPQPTPTPFTGANGYPTVDLTEQYQGKQYIVELAQPVQTGPKGIWVIESIKAA
jgi:hypothetical protein